MTEYYNHALVVGGSGMLANVSRHLANEGSITSVVGRDPSKIKRLQEFSFVYPGKINPIISDYIDVPQFIIDIMMTEREFGPVSLAVVWIHDSSPKAMIRLASVLNNNKCRYIHVLGSSYASPESNLEELITSFEQYKNIDYHPVVLGFKNEGSGSRWLTDIEISDGVIEAISSDKKITTVGEFSPWKMHP